jgi:hypothetical protein
MKLRLKNNTKTQWNKDSHTLSQTNQRKTKVNKIRDEKGNITTNTNDIQRTIKEQFENLCYNTMENLE